MHTNYGHNVTIGDGAIIAAKCNSSKKMWALHNCRWNIQRKSLENDFQETYKVIIRNGIGDRKKITENVQLLTSTSCWRFEKNCK
jgi:acetyltransferase-like isoleucine patch superfamily enzyme